MDVLLRGCSIYQDTFWKCTELNPFVFTTLASSCMGVFKTLFLKKDTLALTYDGAYVGQHKAFSDVSIQWLEYLSHSKNMEVKHAVKHGEHQIGPYFVDGYQPDTKACFYHRSVRCYARAGLNPVTRETYGVFLGQFMLKVNGLKVRYGQEAEVMWECE